MSIDPILAHLRAQPSRTWSIVVTVFGDAIAPRGGEVWLGTLLALMAALGVGDGAVRTAMSRLAADGWVERGRAGRNSFYRLTARGRTTFAGAAETIYRRPAAPGWDGRFSIVLAGVEMAKVDGFVSAAPGVWVALGERLAPSGLALTATAADPVALAARLWPTGRMGAAYGHFLAAFSRLEPATLDDAAAMAARTLLIHEFRRLVLRDPHLPAALLPGDWPGPAAYDLCARLYAALLPGSERWLDTNGRNEAGPLPPADLTGRFVD